MSIGTDIDPPHTTSDYSDDKRSAMALRGILQSCALLLSIALLAIIAYAVVYSQSYEHLRVLQTIVNMTISAFTSPLFVSPILGLFGGTVSIIKRMDELATSRRSPELMYIIGFCAPISGAIFGFVSCAFIMSGFVEFKFLKDEDQGGFKYLMYSSVIGFLAGFSERFTRGLLEKVASSG